MKTLAYVAGLGLVCWTSASAQLFQNLEALSDRIRIGQPRMEFNAFLNENPKGLIAADLDADGKADWAVSRLDGKLVLGWGFGNGKFAPPVVLSSPADEFRELIAADLNGDGRLDLAAAAPYQGKVYLFFNQGNRQFQAPVFLATWEGARNLAAGDFNGDGLTDLAVAGPDRDLRYDWMKPWQAPGAGPLKEQPKTGLAVYLGLGAGQFERLGPPLNWGGDELPTLAGPNTFPRPVHVLRTWRLKESSKDVLLVTHADAQTIWGLEIDAERKLRVRNEIVMKGFTGVRDFVLGAVTTPLATTQDHPEFIVASRDLGVVSIFKATFPLPGRDNPAPAVTQRLDVPGGPRSIELADVDADGWNDLIVVTRYFDRVITFRNEQGKLVKSSEAITGSSPREMAKADFDGDQRPDFVVLNRGSANVSVLLAAPPTAARTGFAALDQSYPVDGDVAQVGLKDLNGDKRDDVLQLHRASAEVSVRMSGSGGRLSEPVFYPMGPNPASLGLGDVNGDGALDLTVANMGDNLGGRVTVRMGDGKGAFGSAKEFFPPEDPPAPTGSGGVNDPDLPAGVAGGPRHGRLYAVLQVDLDGDKKMDLAAGYYDCRIIFYRGDGSGQFTPTEGFSDHELYFMTGYEARFIVAGDFDQDGDQDLGLAAWPGDVVVLENTGNFFLKDQTKPPYKRHFFPRFDNRMAKARDILVDDVNKDGDPDLVVGTGSGTQILIGGPGMAFERRLYGKEEPGLPVLPVIPVMNFPIAALTEGDFDHDGDKDLASICDSDGCLRILTRAEDGQYGLALTVDAPVTTYLASGDVDGDGKTDLVGTGSTLWVALSGRTASTAPPVANSLDRGSVQTVAINEILANNDTVPVPMPEGPADAIYGSVDAIELYNASGTAQSFDGWSLEVIEAAERNSFTFPTGKSLGPKGRQLIVFGNNVRRSPWVTGFRLPKEGAEIILRSSTGEVDRVAYPVLASNQSYARFSDGLRTFRINHLPDPGRANLDNGAVEPNTSIHGISLRAYRQGGPLRFYAKAKDDVGVVGLIIHYRAKNKGSQPFHRVLLYDDGMNGDGGRLDGVFSGEMAESWPPGTEIEFYLEAEDLSGNQTFRPDAPPEEGDETAGSFYTLTTPAGEGAISAIELSELVAQNVNGIANEQGKRVDWLELRNITDRDIPLDGLELADGLFDGSPRLPFPPGTVIPARGYRIVFCDDQSSTATALHAPFKLSSSKGEDIFLIARSASGTQQILDYMQTLPMKADQACARLGPGSPELLCVTPSPGGPNLSPGTVIPMLRETPEGRRISLAYFAPRGVMPVLEASASLQPGSWRTLTVPVGDGYEAVLEVPIRKAEYFRVRP